MSTVKTPMCPECDAEIPVGDSLVIGEVLPGHPVGVLSGPNLAREIMAGQAAASVIAMEDKIIVKELQALFSSGLFRVYTNDDVIGCELGGVLKNIIAIAVGMGDGQGAGDNTRSALITRRWLIEVSTSKPSVRGTSPWRAKYFTSWRLPFSSRTKSSFPRFVIRWP